MSLTELYTYLTHVNLFALRVNLPPHNEWKQNYEQQRQFHTVIGSSWKNL